MQKKLIALAIAAAFSAPAFADNANVNLYGKAILTLDSYTSNQAASVSNMRVASNASRFGVNGSEDVGDGLKAIYQYEVQVDANGAAGNGFGNGTRNSHVGLAGSFGEIALGVWDTPYKVTHNKIELFDNTTAYSATNIIGHATATGGVNYVTRKAANIQYISPSLGGVKVAVMYAPDSAKTATVNKTLLSLSATYDADGIYGSFGYESRPDQTTTGQTDNAMRLVGRYDFGGAWIGATVERIKVNATAAVNYTQSNAEVVGGVKFDASTLALSYAKAGKTNVANTGANQVSLRYGYNFSKRTEVFAAYTSLKNDAAASYGAAIYTGAAAGSTVSAFGVGIAHSF
ncbi:porin [Sideroxydans lithotrophicus]|uniref:Porin Gram-negative type n=1 Tax=Sideroxydans lithotrophicus (strain ES-1) TaxID=580332 RepID=D5CMN1_SIDLE|nr:porin [Sideroxydans lithotrophicus]ADE12703.1 porin Gram-negative type [Sideroxydans lithotrophicus ES-1]